MTPFSNDYNIPEGIPSYSVIPTEEKADWQAKWIWDKDNINKENVWMCFYKSVMLEAVPDTLTAHILGRKKETVRSTDINAPVIPGFILKYF